MGLLLAYDCPDDQCCDGDYWPLRWGAKRLLLFIALIEGSNSVPSTVNPRSGSNSGDSGTQRCVANRDYLRPPAVVVPIALVVPKELFLFPSCSMPGIVTDAASDSDAVLDIRLSQELHCMAILTLRSAGLPEGQKVYSDSELPLSIGRSRRADIVVDDRQLSRVHSEFRVSVAGRFEIVDLDSTNLTIVNEHDVDCVELKTGDRILLGDTEIVVEVEYPDDDIHEMPTRELPAIRPSDAAE